VLIVAGDTKVVPRGALDGLFLNTTGLGELLPGAPPGPTALQPGDALLVTGPIGQHGAAILCAREQFGFDPAPISDCASLAAPLLAVWESGLPVRAARDATRGGVAAVLHEWSAASRLGLTVGDAQLPVAPETRAVCELLGLDPLHLACEGTAVLAVAASAVEDVLSSLRQFPECRGACVIGNVTPGRSTPVRVVRSAGREVPLDEPAGSPLPRIC
jgi:hydrogenase expression/formation protein HypE